MRSGLAEGRAMTGALVVLYELELTLEPAQLTANTGRRTS